MHVINNDSAILQRRRSKTGVNTTQLQPPRIAPLSSDWAAVRFHKLHPHATNNISGIEIFGRHPSRFHKILALDVPWSYNSPVTNVAA